MDSERRSPFGTLLRELRLAAGLSQEALAERARLSAEGISVLERGVRKAPYRETVALLARALDLSPPERERLEAAALRPGPQPRRRGTERIESAEDAPRRENLPSALTSFHGREPELAELPSLLSAQRLVTLTGPGGVGKTRLALRCGALCLERFPAGVWFVDLAPLTDGALVARAVASTLGLHEESQQPILETLAAGLQSKRLMLVLDNCEHLIDAVVELAGALIAKCDGLRLLATSREPLRLAGEFCYLVQPLALPAATAALTVADARAYPALALFVERAGAADPGFRCTAEHVAPVTDICRRLDGIPLAIELAAARVRLLSPSQIADRLDGRFRLLTGGSRTALPRQQTLLAAIEWSYDLLEPAEAELFCRLGVFAGRFGLETVEGVCAADAATPNDEFAVLDRLGGLIDKSLVVANGFEAGRQRYRLLESMRLYARERLNATGEGEELRRRLASHVRLAARQALEQGDRDDIRATDRIEADLDNIRAVIEWAVIERHDTVFGAEFIDELWPFWLDTGKFIEAQRLYRRALEYKPDLVRSLAGKILLGCGLLAWQRWAFDEARALLEEALTVLRPLPDERQVCRALNGLAVVCDELGEFERAESLYEESLAIARRLNDSRAIATVLMNLGILAETHRSDYERAEGLYGECLRAARAHGDTAQEAHALRNLAELAARRDQHDLVITYAEESLPLLRALRHEEAVAVSEVLIGTAELARGNFGAARVFLREALPAIVALHRGPELVSLFTAFAGLALADNDEKTAAQLLGFAQTLASAIPEHETVKQRDRIEALVAKIRDRIDRHEFDAYARRGRSMTLQQAAETAQASAATTQA